jgi:hypothetical protein
MDLATPWPEDRVERFLDTAAYLVSKDYATPWVDFDSVPPKYQYPVTIFAAIEYWWAKAGEYATKFDMQVGGNTGQKSSQLFDRAMALIGRLENELGSLGLIDEGSGDIIVGDLVIRSKHSGYLVPRANDPNGDWLS